MRIHLYVYLASLLGLAAGGCFVDARQEPIADAGESLRHADDCGRDDYQPCHYDQDNDQKLCREPNSACARYVSDPGTGFCAPLCQRDEDCPTRAGLPAACNFAFCALLCAADGGCPEGMRCLRGAEFIDSTGAKRGVKDVCVTAP